MSKLSKSIYLTPTEKHWACDIEADNLLDEATTIWCCTVENVLSGEKHAFTDSRAFDSWNDGNRDIYFVGHNFIAYDLVMLNRHWGCRISVSRVVDTYVLSQLYNPSFQGGHSLEAWGGRLRHPKTEFSDFSRYTPEMLEYCANDTSLTALLYRKLTSRMRALGFTEQGAEIEHLSWNIIQNKQRRHGFPFNYEKAHKLYVQIRAREEELKDEIYELWPPRLEIVGEYSKHSKKDGTRSAQYIRHVEQYPKVREIEGGGYVVYDYVSFNLGSPIQRIEKLLELGWEPTKFTAKTASGGGGNPQVDEESLLDFAEVSGKREVAALAKWIVANSRANMIRTWMDAYNEKTGAIHGRLFIASTLRYRHSNPNSANIPAVRTKKVAGHDQPLYGEEGAWTYESRDLFDTGDPETFSLVGIDAKGIQLRVLANYAYSDGFVASVLAGDPHTKNIEVLGLANKPAAKKFLYTTLMGGGGAKLAADQGQFGTKLTEKDGTRLKNLLIDSIPGFRQLIKRLQDELTRTGRITLCDGTPILVPSPHMVIPYLLQGDESRIMKLTSVYIDEEIRRRKWTNDVFKVADIHDEYQFKVRKSVVDDFITMALAQFIRAGETFRYKIKIEGDAKVGETWACTH